jgi:hypothetical protein
MTDGPTTENGPLHDKPPGTPAITASFADLASAKAAQTALVRAGIDASRIDVADQTNVGTTAAPADEGLLGRIREAILPEDGETAIRTAIHNNETILTLYPEPTEVEMAITILEAAKPAHFDPSLERWRNARSG